MFKTILKSQLSINIVSGFIVRIIYVCAILLSYPIYLHFLGYKIYGIWLLLATVISFSQMGKLGINQAIIKFVAEAYSQNDSRELRRYVTNSFFMLLIAAIVMVLFIIVLRNYLPSLFGLSGKQKKVFITLLPYVAIISAYLFIVEAYVSIITGIGRMDIRNYIDIGCRCVILAVSVFFLNIGFNIVSLLIGNSIGYICINILSYLYIRIHYKYKLFSIKLIEISVCKKILKYSFGLMGATATGILIDPITKSVLSRYLGVESLPIYDICQKGTMQARSLVDFGFQALMPKVSELGTSIATSSKIKIQKLNISVIKFILITIFPSFLILGVFISPVLKIWLGLSFRNELLLPFRILLISCTISALNIPGYYILLGLGYSVDIFYAHAILATSHAFLMFLYITLFNTISVPVVASTFLFGTACATFYLIMRTYIVVPKYFDKNRQSSMIKIY